MGFKSSLFVVLLAVGVFYYMRLQTPLVCFADKTDFDSNPACLFSETYEHARARFREATLEHHGKISTLTVMDDLTIDVAVFNEATCGESVLLLSSGVHGVEGFTGSAIQLGLIKSSAEFGKQCVVLIHAVNPFGFANLRRWNENNVDLNRNALMTADEWKQVLDRDPNVAGYEDLLDFMEARAPPNFFRTAFWVGRLLATHGFSYLKRALVTATYHRPRGLFFGGQELQKSHQLIRQFLVSRGLTRTKKICFFDLHTGLGPQGMDSLMATDAHSEQVLQRLIDTTHLEPRPYSLESFGTSTKPGKAGGASEGYELTRGHTEAGWMGLFSNTTEVVAATQEFGTYPGVMVILALQQENEAYHFNRETRHYWARNVREVFNPTSEWYRTEVTRRGRMLARLGLEHLKK